jgi:ribosomal protein S27AE
MALIKCPECGKEVSDKALTCIHCGCPLVEKNHCIINGVDVDCSFLFDPKYEDIEIKELIMMEKTNLDAGIADKIVEEWSKKGEIPPVFNGKISTYEEESRQAMERINNQLHCPKCGSTSITTGARGVNWFWGFIGANKTVNRCGKCGYTWEP